MGNLTEFAQPVLCFSLGGQTSWAMESGHFKHEGPDLQEEEGRSEIIHTMENPPFPHFREAGCCLT